MFQDVFDDVGVVFYVKLVGYGEQQCVGFGNCFVLVQFFNEFVWFSGIIVFKYCVVIVDVFELVVVFLFVEVGLVEVVGDGKNVVVD